MYVKPFWILRVPFRRWWSACFKVSGGVCSFGLGCRRSRQIAALKSAGLRLKVQDSDDSVWDVIVSNLYGDLSFRVYVNNALLLVVADSDSKSVFTLHFHCRTLPKDFPEAPPELRLLVQAQHPWAAPNLRIVGHPKLASWTPHSSLAGIVTVCRLSRPPGYGLLIFASSRRTCAQSFQEIRPFRSGSCPVKLR